MLIKVKNCKTVELKQIVDENDGVLSIAEELNESPNGVRMILTRAGVYIKKNPSAGNSAGKTGRVSKAECHQMLVDAVSSHGGSLDMDIISKISGKAAKHIAEQIVSN